MALQNGLGIGTWKLYLRTHRLVLEKLKRQMQREHNLPLAWFDVLAQLSLAGGKLRMTELADAILLSGSGLTRLLDRMEKATLITREPCENDRRGYWAKLTEEGQQLVKKAWPEHAKGIHQHFLDHLTAHEIATLKTAFGKILRAEDSDSRD